MTLSVSLKLWVWFRRFVRVSITEALVALTCVQPSWTALFLGSISYSKPKLVAKRSQGFSRLKP